MQNKNLLIIAAVAIVVILTGGYFLLPKSKTSIPVAPTSVPTKGVFPTQATEKMEKESIKEVEVEGDEFKFIPSSLNFTKGEKVKLTFKNIGRQSHNLVIDELGVGTKTIPAGVREVLEFTANESGTFSFYCSIGNHRALGMEGRLEVK